ncbi:C1 family peptidase [Roseateles sp.]|uniref:C1 family peptidase n=1 Tax=Roseateles sp. TaxID=1971397 RepID=UPI003BA6A65E
MPNLDINTLSKDLNLAKARWTARQTPQSMLTDSQKMALLGVIFTKEFIDAGAAPAAQSKAAPAFAPAVDWRNRNGNHVTSVKDQKNCGSCVSFCCTALVESMASIEKGQLLNLSEADAHFGSSHGASCSGWNANDCLEQIKVRGVVPDALFPYMAAFENPPQSSPAEPHYWIPHAGAIPNRAASAIKINSHGLLSSIVDRKNYLSNVGPCSASFDVYDDFFSYGSGVYHHVSGVYRGGHCVEVIGYSEAEQCWICKNSWAESFGMAGYFKIGYGECKFDAYPFATAQGVVLPPPQVGWHGYESLGGIITSRPSATSWAANRIDVVARGTDSAVHHRWWDGSSWQGWESLGGGIQGAPAICSWGNGRLDIFAVGMDHRMYHKWFQGGWSGWESLGGQFSSEPCAVSWGPNRIDIFGRGLDSAMYHMWWDGAHWGGWENLGGVLASGPAVSSWAANRLDCFVKGTDSKLYHKWWNGAWSGWESLGGYVSAEPAAESWGPNRIDVFYAGATSHMMHKWWNGSSWSGEEDLGGILSSGVGVSSWAPGRLDCFVEGTDSAMYHKWYA